MGSPAILQSHAGKRTRSKFHGEKVRESSRVLQVLSAEDALCVHRQTAARLSVCALCDSIYYYIYLSQWAPQKSTHMLDESLRRTYFPINTVGPYVQLMVDVSIVRHLWVCQQNFSVPYFCNLVPVSSVGRQQKFLPSIPPWTRFARVHGGEMLLNKTAFLTYLRSAVQRHCQRFMALILESKGERFSSRRCSRTNLQQPAYTSPPRSLPRKI